MTGIGIDALDRIEAIDALMDVLGLSGDFVLGGEGGDGGTYYNQSCNGDGGHGGVGLLGSTDLFSGVLFAGGEHGCEGGSDGLPYDGDVQFIDPAYPVLVLPPNIEPGISFPATVHGAPGENVSLIISNATGWL